MGDVTNLASQVSLKFVIYETLEKFVRSMFLIPKAPVIFFIFSVSVPLIPVQVNMSIFLVSFKPIFQ